MFDNIDAIATVAVRDLGAARRFYEQTLGLKPIDSQGEEVIVYRTGKSALNVYRSQFAGTNQATAVTWNVGGAIDDVVAKLKAKGVKFEHYDGIVTDAKGISPRAGGGKVAWFNDPDGNTFAIEGDS